jgi:hypothetical protein
VGEGDGGRGRGEQHGGRLGVGTAAHKRSRRRPHLSQTIQCAMGEWTCA